MTLDPVHFEGITQLAGRIDHGADEDEHRDFAETVWESFLDPLTDGRGRLVAEPVGDDGPTRHLVDCEAVALSDRPFQTVHGLDAGTINPTTFKNGLVIDAAQAAMAATPTDLDLHRSRTVVMTVHSSDRTATVTHDEWDRFDEGTSRRRVVKIPSVDRFAEGVVHALALYLAESEHALEHAERVSDLLVLDGPLYPRGLLRWRDQHPDLEDVLTREPQPTTVVENYVRLVETFVERGVPLLGFVKNPATRALTRAIRERIADDWEASRGIDAPWGTDADFFARVLERGEYVKDVEGYRWERETDALTYTGWFRSRGGVDRVLSPDGEALGVERSLPLDAYEVTFFAVYDPREDLLYRVEAPLAFTEDPSLRERLRKHVLGSVAHARGPPRVVEKADELARISVPEKRSLRAELESQFETDQSRTYDDNRWSESFE